MSRIGKLPISIPAGVTVTLKDNVVTVKGPKGEMSQYVNPAINVAIEDGHVTLTENDKEQLFYKDEPFTTKKLHQRLIITYSPKYAAYQKAIRAEQISRAEKMVANGTLKKQRKNPNDPARFVNKVAVTNEGEKATIHYYIVLIL